MHTFRTIQQLPITKEEAWDFFSTPSSLQTITPAYMGFVITGGYKPGDKMIKGMQISYKVKPVLSIPLTWVTLISEVEAPYFFADEQLKGPYAYWRHEHRFREIPGGIEMEDIVSYKVPFSFLGRIANTLFVRQQLKSIFDYRFEILEKHFGTMNVDSSAKHPAGPAIQMNA